MSHADAAPRRDRPAIGFLVLACALTTFPSVTGDIYLPALPQMTADFAGTTVQGQHTLASYFLGLGTGQLFYGPLADRLGRRPVMLFGALLYLAATMGCLIAGSIDQLVALRFVQALGACAGLVISATIVRDQYGDEELPRIFSMLLTARSLGPLLAPIAGGVLVTFFGWRGVFGALCLFGLSLLLAILLAMRETRPHAVAERARSESPLRAYWGVLRDRRIMGYVLTNGCNFGSMFAWITVAPFLVIEIYGVSEIWFGWIFAALALGISLAAQINRRLVKRYPADRVMLWGAFLMVGAAIVLLVDVLAGIGGLVGILLPLFFVIASLGLVSTNAMAGALAVDPTRSGSASAIVGTSQFAFAALVAGAMGYVSSHPAFGLAVVIAACAIGAALYPLSLARQAKAAA